MSPLIRLWDCREVSRVRLKKAWKTLFKFMLARLTEMWSASCSEDRTEKRLWNLQAVQFDRFKVNLLSGTHSGGAVHQRHNRKIVGHITINFPPQKALNSDIKKKKREKLNIYRISIKATVMDYSEKGFVDLWRKIFCMILLKCGVNLVRSGPRLDYIRGLLINGWIMPRLLVKTEV